MTLVLYCYCFQLTGVISKCVKGSYWLGYACQILFKSPFAENLQLVGNTIAVNIFQLDCET